jgi:hypothetical protein
MYNPRLHSSLVNAHIDDLRRSMAASRGRRSSVAGRPGRGLRQTRRSGANDGVRALVARFAI